MAPRYDQPIAGPAAAALSSLTAEQLAFIRSLHRAELHAHLNGSIPLALLQTLARERADSLMSGSNLDAAVSAGLARLESGVQLTEIGDFFGLFRAIYALTDRPETLKSCTQAVLAHFLEGEHPEAQYLELRTTPRVTPHMTRREYLEAVLEEVERFSPDQAALIVSMDRTMSLVDKEDVANLAIALRKEGRCVVGLDVCGDPLVRVGLDIRFCD
jgi:adenosine deaminase